MKVSQRYKKLFWGILVILLLTSAKGFCNEVWQFYRINAQYRGMVKKSYRNIGCALAWFKELSKVHTQVIAHVCAVHPEKKAEIYSFRVNLIINRGYDNIKVDQVYYQEFRGFNKNRQDQVQQLVCLWDYIRNYEGSSWYKGKILNISGIAMNLRKSDLRNRVEINANSSEYKNFSSKFFIKKSSDQSFSMDKFRFRTGKVVISLVRDSGDSVSRDFRYREPFASIVFDNK
jgi:hypothetical protein